jgi:YVTN family beta-propeller protein
VTLGGESAYLSFAGSHAVAALRLGGGVELSARAAPGAGPRGLGLTPDGRYLWVANHLGNSLTVLDARTLATERTIPLGRASRPDPTLYGRYLFESAFLARGEQFSCNSCHPDGHTDGIDWKFVHVKDGVDKRNVRSLRGGLEATAPFRWSGVEAELSSFVQSEITGLLQHPSLPERDLRAIARYVESLPLPPNPHRNPDSTLSAAGARGRKLFAGKAGCADCHGGPRHGGTGRRAWVGTTPEGLLLDVPHLNGAYDSAPYLHDGRAVTLEEIFARQNAPQRHGRAHLLTEAEMRDLIQFVREL